MATTSKSVNLSSGNVGAGEDEVLLVLVDGPRVGDGVGVLDDGDRLSGQDGLVDAEGGRHDGHDTDVSGDLVADCKKLINDT